MRFTSPTLLSVFLITFVSAIPAPDKYKHFKDPGCPGIGARACIFVDYCNSHRKLGDLFISRGGNLKSRDAPEPENLDFNLTDSLSPSLPSSFTTRELDVNWKRAGASVACGVLSSVTSKEISGRFGLIAGLFYDLVIDYPYDGATGGLIGVFAMFSYNGVQRMKRLGTAHSAFGGVRFRFQAHQEALWYQVIFGGDQATTAVVKYYILKH